VTLVVLVWLVLKEKRYFLSVKLYLDVNVHDILYIIFVLILNTLP